MIRVSVKRLCLIRLLLRNWQTLHQGDGVSRGQVNADVADNVPYIDISGVNDEAGETVTFFAVNRHGSETLPVEISLQGFGTVTVIDHQVMTHSVLDAVNTATDQTNGAPRKGNGATVKKGVLKRALEPYSYSMICVKVAG